MGDALIWEVEGAQVMHNGEESDALRWEMAMHYSEGGER
jgi:hypothetical protein